MKQCEAYKMIGDLIDDLYEKKPHAVWEHAYTTDDHLKARIAIEKKDGASCFNKDVDIIETIVEIIEESPDVLPWIMKSNEASIIICVKKDNCGRKFLRNKDHKWDDGAIICNHVKVILGKSKDKYGYMTGIHLLTAYPV